MALADRPPADALAHAPKPYSTRPTTPNGTMNATAQSYRPAVVEQAMTMPTSQATIAISNR